MTLSAEATAYDSDLLPSLAFTRAPLHQEKRSQLRVVPKPYLALGSLESRTDGRHI